MRALARNRYSRSYSGMPRAERPRAAARKTPRQERARGTVEVILEAAARILARDGWAKATTNRIAEAAGVSVGSLYQYFPSKEAIAVELLKRYRERLAATVAERLAAAESVTFEGAMATLLEALFEAKEIDPRLHRVLIEQVLRTHARGEMQGFEDRLEAVVAEALAGAGPSVRVENPALAATVVVRAVLGLVHAVVVDRPDLDRRAVAAEVTKLVTRYLA
jgi:AcrR family transcriptional regulator